MRDCQYDHLALRVSDVADEAMISQPVAPQALLVSMQHLPKLAGALCWLHPFSQVARNIRLRLTAQLAYLPFNGPAELNVPGQAPAGSADLRFSGPRLVLAGPSQTADLKSGGLRYCFSSLASKSGSHRTPNMKELASVIHTHIKHVKGTCLQSKRHRPRAKSRQAATALPTPTSLGYRTPERASPSRGRIRSACSRQRAPHYRTHCKCSPRPRRL
jgi:hypothetical protein